MKARTVSIALAISSCLARCQPRAIKGTIGSCLLSTITRLSGSPSRVLFAFVVQQLWFSNVVLNEARYLAPQSSYQDKYCWRECLCRRTQAQEPAMQSRISLRDLFQQ